MNRALQKLIKKLVNRAALLGRTPGNALPIEPLEERRLLSSGSMTVTYVTLDNRGQAAFQFSKTPNGSTLTQTNILMFTAGNDGKLGTADDAAVAHTIQYTGGYLYVTASSGLSADTNYRVVLRTGIFSTDGKSLSGNTGANYVGGNYDISTTKTTTIARFGTIYGPLLFVLNNTVTPKTYANFKGYADGKYYDGTIIHRSETKPNSTSTLLNIVQGGGYKVSNGSLDLVDTHGTENAGLKVEPGFKNLAGSIAMASLGDSTRPDNITGQWFINTSNNNALDGNYTVFGYRYGAADQTIINQLHTRPTVVNANGTNSSGAFGELPVVNWQRGQSIDPAKNLVVIGRISMLLGGAPTKQVAAAVRPAASVATGVAAAAAVRPATASNSLDTSTTQVKGLADLLA